MKKILVLLMGLAVFAASASDFRSQSLINGSEVRVVDNTTKAFGDTNVYYRLPNGQYTYSFTSTNVVLFVTNGVSGAGTNATVVNTNFISPGAFAASGSAGHNFDGTPNSNASFSMTLKTLGVLQTNAVTVTLERSANGTDYDAVSTFQFAYTITTNISRCVMTNLPSAFLTGASTIRIKSIAADDNGSDGTNVVEKASINIWAQ